MRIALLIGDQAYTPKIGMLANSRNDVALFERLRSWKREQICRRGSRGDSQGRADATDVCCDGEVISESTMLGKAGVKGRRRTMLAAVACNPHPWCGAPVGVTKGRPNSSAPLPPTRAWRPTGRDASFAKDERGREVAGSEPCPERMLCAWLLQPMMMGDPPLKRHVHRSQHKTGQNHTQGEIGKDTCDKPRIAHGTGHGSILLAATTTSVRLRHFCSSSPAGPAAAISFPSLDAASLVVHADF